MAIFFTIYLFTADGHRYTIDEEYAFDHSKSLATLTPHPLFIQGESKIQFQYPQMFPPRLFAERPLCVSAFTCFPTYILHPLTQVPFVWFNHHFNAVTSNTVVLSSDDFDDPHYVFWRNSLDPDLVFLDLFYGPIVGSLSVAVFFLLCREFSYSIKISLFLSFLYGLSTLIWVYSQTILNLLPLLLFVTLGFYYIKKYKNYNYPKYLCLGSIFFGLAFLSRKDAVLFIIPVSIFVIFVVTKQNHKIRSLLFYFVPLIFSYMLDTLYTFLRDGTLPFVTATRSVDMALRVGTSPTPFYESILGQLIGPGLGLFIFAPILLTVFFSFPDFYKKNKHECILFISFISSFLIYYGTAFESWHGFVAWGPRYLVPVIPFLLIPLGASLTIRKSVYVKITAIGLGITGFFFNLVALIQDVSWFVWSIPGWHKGLFGLCDTSCPLYIHKAVIWTFSYSQLTWSLNTLFTSLQHDVYLIHLWGVGNYALVFSLLMTVPLLYLRKFYKSHVLEKPPQ